MSIMICSSCERKVDTDFHESHLIEGKEVCGACVDRADECPNWGSRSPKIGGVLRKTSEQTIAKHLCDYAGSPQKSAL